MWCQRKTDLYSKPSQLINKWLEESCGESESKVEVPDKSDSYFSDESDIKTIDSVAPDEILDNLASLGAFTEAVAQRCSVKKCY